MRRFEEAITACQDAAAIYRDTGDRHGEGMALTNLGNTLAEVRRFEEAITAHQDAAAVYREIDDRHGEGLALEGLGLALDEAGRSREAVTAYQDAIAVYRETGDEYREGITREPGEGPGRTAALRPPSAPAGPVSSSSRLRAAGVFVVYAPPDTVGHRRARACACGPQPAVHGDTPARVPAACVEPS